MNKKFKYYNSDECDTLLTLMKNMKEYEKIIEVNIDLLIKRGEDRSIIASRATNIKEISANK